MTSKNFTVKHRRRREQKTDYKLRRKLLMSDIPRLVIRKSNKNVYVQVIDFVPNGDKVLSASESRQLIKLGWNYSRSNLPAFYLTGLMTGLKAKKAGVKKVIVDFGLSKVLSKGKLYAAVKGVKDAGLNVVCSDKVLPDEKACSGQKIADYAKLLKEDKVAYDRQFAGYLKAKVKPEEIVNAFTKVKESIKKKW